MKGDEIIKILENVTKPIYQIETQIGMPITTLQKAIKGKRKLPKKWAIRLKDYVERKMYLLSNTKYEPEKLVKKQNITPLPEPHTTSNDTIDSNSVESSLTNYQLLRRKKMGL